MEGDGRSYGVEEMVYTKDTVGEGVGREWLGRVLQLEEENCNIDCR